MKKNVEVCRLTGTALSFEMSAVDDGYIRIYNGMVAIGRLHNNRRRDEFVVSMDDLKAAIAESEEASQ